MPSSSDRTAEQAVEAADRVLSAGRGWMDNGRMRFPAPRRARLDAVERIGAMLRADSLPVEQRARLMRRLSEITDTPLPRPAPDAENQADAFNCAVKVATDEALRSDPLFSKRYFKRLYRALDSALEYNSTTDAIRNTRIIMGLRTILEAGHRRSCSFADVGCAMAAGAPGTIAAAKILREGGTCSMVHGVDITAPDRTWATRMLKEHGILFYGCDPARRRLPRAYDAILLANVHRHLDRDAQERLLSNLGISLEENGILAVNWRFDAHNSPCLCLRKKGPRLECMLEFNAI